MWHTDILINIYYSMKVAKQNKNQLFDLKIKGQYQWPYFYHSIYHVLLHTHTNHENCTIKYQLFDLVFKGQGHCNHILICDIPPCPNTHT